MRKLPPLTELRAFEAASRHMSFQRAAAELGVTPTAISHQVRLLELYCGCALFRRRPRPIRLTAAGERLFPVVRDGLYAFADALSSIRAGAVPSAKRLSITATNAFAARWLVPRLPLWRATHPDLKLDVVGTDVVLDLEAGEADVAIRYAVAPPRGGVSFELLRDRFHVVASPKLVGDRRRALPLAEIAAFPLIEAEWPATDAHAPTWRRWQRAASTRRPREPDLGAQVSVRFREELHAIEAAIAGQGIAICSDVLVAPELADGTLVRVSRVTLPGYGFHVLHGVRHPRIAAVEAFVAWIRGVAAASPAARSSALR